MLCVGLLLPSNTLTRTCWQTVRSLLLNTELFKRRYCRRLRFQDVREEEEEEEQEEVREEEVRVTQNYTVPEAGMTERRTHDLKVASSSPGKSGGRLIFSRVNFSASVPPLCYRSGM